MTPGQQKIPSVSTLTLNGVPTTFDNVMMLYVGMWENGFKHQVEHGHLPGCPECWIIDQALAQRGGDQELRFEAFKKAAKEKQNG